MRSEQDLGQTRLIYCPEMAVAARNSRQAGNMQLLMEMVGDLKGDKKKPRI